MNGAGLSLDYRMSKGVSLFSLAFCSISFCLHMHFFGQNAFNSIRRSAQNKMREQRLRSQPSNEDAFNGSFTEFAREAANAKESAR